MLITVLLFVVILGLLVFVHEFGHFIVAKKMGAAVEEFGFGFPPRAVGFYKVGKKIQWVFRKTPRFAEPLAEAMHRTIYSINWIPLGGFVKIKGEDGGDKTDPDSFAGKSVGKRAAILAAGVTMNIILAVIVLSIGFVIGVPQTLDKNLSGATVRDRSIQIVAVAEESAAAASGLAAGDEILSIDGKFFTYQEMRGYLTSKIGESVLYSIKRDGAIFEKEIAPSILKETGYGGIGVGLIETGIVSYSWYTAIWRGLVETFYFVGEITAAFFIFFKDLIIGKGVSMDLSGPVGIAVMTGRVARLGFSYILQFTAVLSVNLAIVNILPFPALDGGRLLFLAIEKIRRRPVSQKIEFAVHNFGFMALMLLIVLVTYRDFIRFGDKFQNLWQNIIR